MAEAANQAVEEKVSSCEPEDKCCYCVPIDTGLKAVSVLHIVCTVMYISIGGVLLNIDWMAGVLYYVVFVPWMIASVFYIRFLVHDTKMHREALVWAVWLSFATVVMGAIAEVAVSYTTGELNSQITKAHNAVNSTKADHVTGHKKGPRVDANVIPREEFAWGDAVFQFAYNLVWSYYLATVIKRFAK